MKFITIHSLKFFFRRGGVPPPPVVSVFFVVFCGLLDYNGFGDYMKTNRKPFVISLLCGFGGIILPICILIVRYLNAPKGSMGIIGGAHLAITGKYIVEKFFQGIFGNILMLGVCVTIASVFCLIFNKAVVNNCNLKSTLVTFGSSFFTVMGLYGLLIAVLSNQSWYPYLYVFGVGSLILGFLGVLGCFVLYFIVNNYERTIKGVLFDILTYLFSLAPSLIIYLMIYKFLEAIPLP